MSWRAKLQPATIGHGLAVAAMVLIPLFHPGKAYAAGAFVKQSPVNITVANSNSIAATLPSAATAGDLIVLVCNVNGASNITATGYTAAAGPVNGTVSQGIFYKVAVGGETTATCTSSLRTKNGLAAHMYVYSGMKTVSPLNVSGTANGTGTALSSGSATPTRANSLVFTAFTAVGGTGFTGITAGYTERSDAVNTIHVGQADLFTALTTAQAASATNSVSSAWRGQIAIFKVEGAKTADIVDGSGAAVASPSVTFPSTVLDFTCHPLTATLGTATQKIRVSNASSSSTWSVALAATGGATAFWDAGGGKTYDFNDPTADGCTDGGDADSLRGKMTVNPTTGTITPSSGCNNTGVTLGSSLGFSQGTQDSITLVTAGASALTDCSWDITGIQLNQYIPAEQPIGTYSLSLTLTLLAS